MNALFRRTRWPIAIGLLALPVALVLLGRGGPDVSLSQADDTPPRIKSTGVSWGTRLSDGYTQAQQRGQPILVRIETTSCEFCRKLEAELDRPELVAELKRWTLVTLDAEASPEAKSLDFDGVPALRILTRTVGLWPPAMASPAAKSCSRGCDNTTIRRPWRCRRNSPPRTR